jgi:hypothetical protein
MARSFGLHVDEPKGERWTLALDLLADGKAVELENLRLWPEDQIFRVGVLSSWKTQVTHATAMEDIARAQFLIEPLLERDDGFAHAVAGRELRYELIIDPGMGAVGIAELVNGKLAWAPGLRPVPAK